MFGTGWLLGKEISKQKNWPVTSKIAVSILTGTAFLIILSIIWYQSMFHFIYAEEAEAVRQIDDFGITPEELFRSAFVLSISSGFLFWLEKHTEIIKNIIIKYLNL